jgi:hypothetical protein
MLTRPFSAPGNILAVAANTASAQHWQLNKKKAPVSVGGIANA